MKVDYSYIETFFKSIDGKADVSELESNVGFRTVMIHAHRTSNNFNIKDIENAIKGISDKAYGLRNVLKNSKRIKALYRILKTQENEWLKEVKTYVGRLFNDIDYEITTIYPIIGYDIGIGINRNVCVNLNSELCLKDYRELISIIIHEVTHTYYESIHGSILDSFKIETQADMTNLLNKAIQYEGAGIFSAEEYRVKNNLPDTGSRIQEDYIVLTDKDKRVELMREYKELSKDLMSGKLEDKQEFFQRGFGQSKLAHRLGYSIFTEINEARGIDGVREAINMSNEDFVVKYLK